VLGEVRVVRIVSSVDVILLGLCVGRGSCCNDC
jgi:hypothetical protein